MKATSQTNTTDEQAEKTSERAPRGTWPAFPGASGGSRGVNLRDYFAAAALQGLLASGKPMGHAERACEAVAAAEALLRELDASS